MDASWALEARLTVIGFEAGAPPVRSTDSVLSRFMEQTASRSPQQLQALKRELRVGIILDDSSLCVTALSCRYEGVEKFVSMSAALVDGDSAEFALSFNQRFVRTTRSGTKESLFGGTSWRFVLTRMGGVWRVRSAQAFST